MRRATKSKKRKLPKKKVILATIILVIIIIIAYSITTKKQKKQQEQINQLIEQSQELTITDSNLAEYVKETNDGTKINISPKINETKTIDGLEITNIQITSSNGVTTLIADVKNNTDTATALKNVLVKFLDQNGKELVSVNGIIMPLEIGQSTKLNVSLSSNYVTSYDINIVNKKYNEKIENIVVEKHLQYFLFLYLLFFIIRRICNLQYLENLNI